MRGRALFESVVCLALMVWLAACSSGHSSPSDGPCLKGNPKKIKNPVAPTPESLATGKRLYDPFCRACPGRTGRGDGGKTKKPPPAGEPKGPAPTQGKW